MGSLKASEQDRDGCGLNNEATLANEHHQQQQQQQQQKQQPKRQHQQQQQEQAETIYLRPWHTSNWIHSDLFSISVCFTTLNRNTTGGQPVGLGKTTHGLLVANDSKLM